MGLHGVLGAGHVSHRDLADMLGIHPKQLHDILRTAQQQDVSFMQAARMEGVDFSQIDTRTFGDSFRELPPQAQAMIARDAASLPATLREVVTSSVPPPPSGDSTAASNTGNQTNAPASGTQTSPGNPTNPNTASNPNNTSSSTTVNNGGNAPPGQNNVHGHGHGRTDAAATSIPIDAGIRIVPGHAPQRGEGVDNHNLIQRLFGGEGQQRAESGQNLGALANRAVSQGPEAVQNPQSLLHARNDGNQAQAPQQSNVWGREGNAQQQATPQSITMPGRVDASAIANPGNTLAAQQGTPQSAAFSGQHSAAPTPNALAAQQGAPQTAAYAGQQTATQAQLADRAVMQSPLPANVRGDATMMGAARAPDAAMPAASLERMQTAQQQLANQQQATIPNVPGRPELAGGQLAATLAGATVIANPQAHTMAQQVGQNVMPTPPGSDAALAARDALLAPAGHTLSGFLRRDARNGMQPHRRAADWVAAMLMGRRKRQAEGSQPSVVSVQWLFWILTVLAYGAIGTAVVFMLPNGGEPGMTLTTTEGTPSIAGYALLIGAAAAIASWLIGKRIGRAGNV